MLYSDSKMPEYSAKSNEKGGSPMEQRPLFSAHDTVEILRLELEEAFDRGDPALARILSRQMDDIQLRHWAAALAPAS